MLVAYAARATVFLPDPRPDPPRVRRSAAAVILPTQLFAALLVLAASPSWAQGPGSSSTGLVVTGMTFVGSRGGERDLVVEAERARLDPLTSVATLEGVHAVVEEEGGRPGMDVSCQRGELSTRTSDLLAEGEVRGSIGDGRRFATSWVRYDHRRRLAYTDAPVWIEDRFGTLRGGGFRYHADQARFRLLGGASVVQQP